MPDFSTQLEWGAPSGTIHAGASTSLLMDGLKITGGSMAAGAVWPAANRALYMPFIVESTVTAFQIGFEVTVQSGNMDVGIYNERADRLVSMGTQTVPAVGFGSFNIADTILTPGVYFAAMNIDNVTAAVVRGNAPASALWLQVLGMQQQAVGAVTLPNPATFANPASAYFPQVAIATKSTI